MIIKKFLICFLVICLCGCTVSEDKCVLIKVGSGLFPSFPDLPVRVCPPPLSSVPAGAVAASSHRYGLPPVELGTGMEPLGSPHPQRSLDAVVVAASSPEPSSSFPDLEVEEIGYSAS